MILDYTKLWKLLAEKGMTKTELIELSGISSRVLAKLTKNQTVTTETIARICQVLHCDVGDVMECVEEEALSLYHHYKANRNHAAEAEHYNRVCFLKNGQTFEIFTLKEKATKATHLHFGEDGTLERETLYPFGGHGCHSSVREFVGKFTPEKGKASILLIKGKPGAIFGLDEGVFSSHQKIAENKIAVMTEGALKCFEPRKGEKIGTEGV